jgi:hypothetical protein
VIAQNSIRVGFVVLAPLAVALLNAVHPIVRQPVYEGIVASLNWWLVLHLLSLAGFPLLGWVAYLLVREIENWAAVVAKAAIAVFVPVYVAFDALAGVGTGTLVQQISCLQAAQVATFKLTVDAFWSSTPLAITAIVGSIAWMIAMLASAVALTASERRKRIAGLAVIVFFVGGWLARHSFLPTVPSLAWRGG